MVMETIQMKKKKVMDGFKQILKLIQNYHLLLSVIIILVLFACKEDIKEGYLRNRMNIEFQASLEPWNAEEYAVTRSQKQDSVTVEVVPVTSDDGEEFILIATTESDLCEPESSITTRGTNVVSSISNLVGKKVLTYAYINGDAVEDQLLLNGEEYTIGSDYSWLPKGTDMLEWPSPTQVISFYGIIPTTENNFSIHDKTLSFTQTTVATTQKDLIIGATEPLNRLKDAVKEINGEEVKQPVKITFRHALTAVEFKAGDIFPNGTLKQIELIGFSKTGIFTFPTGSGSGTWTPGTDESTFTASSTNNLNVALYNKYNTLNGGSQNFLMIPQSMSNTKKLRLTVNYNGATKYLTASFNGLKAWEAGKKVTYTLTRKSTSGYYLYTNYYAGDGSQYAYINTNTTFYVYSFALNTTNGTSVTKTAVPWRLYQWNNGSLHNFPSESTFTESTNISLTLTGPNGAGYIYGSGGTAGETINIKRARSNKWNFTGTRVEMGLDMATQRGGSSAASAVDLSKRNNEVSGATSNTSNKVNTANCYIVNGQGWYKFPVVYGKGIKNGNNNTDAYSGYKGYDGKNITSPWINNTSELEAKIVYVDGEISPEISDVAMITENNQSYIRFKVNTNNSMFGSGYNQSQELGNYLGRNFVLPGNAVIGLFKKNTTQLVWQWHIYLYNEPQNIRDLGFCMYGEYTQNNSAYIILSIRQSSSASNSAAQTSTSPTCDVTLRYDGGGADYSTRMRSTQYNWGSAYPQRGTDSGWGKSAVFNTTPTAYLTESQNTQSTRWKDNVKTIFDPCPYGYRVPNKDRWADIQIDPSSLFKLGWYALDGETSGILLSIPTGSTNSKYLTSTYSSGKYHYKLIENTSQIVGSKDDATAPVGMIHPVKE